MWDKQKRDLAPKTPQLCDHHLLNDYEVCRYVQLENGLYADVYSLEIIIPIAFRLDTYYTNAFRSWLVKKTVAGDGRKASYVVFMRAKKGNWN